MTTYKIGVDIGGTFTDLVMMGSNGRVVTKKVSSTPDQYGRAIISGIVALLAEVDAPASAVRQIVHGTTVAANTVLEDKGAATALVTTAGFRDVLELRRLRRPSLYNLLYKPPKPLVPRNLRFEVAERMGPRGEVKQPLGDESLREVGRALQRASVESVAICLLHSYANPAHEQAVARYLKDLLPPATYISCSTDIAPEIREYERTSTTVVNAYLGPVVERYLSRLLHDLEVLGVAPRLQLMQSDGLLLDARSVIRRPACIIESGPAAGVIAAARTAALAGHMNVITFDMGGTTAKAALIENGQPTMTTDYEVGAGINLSSKLVKGAGHAVRLPFIDLSEIGAGGGSLIAFDRAGHLHVGPQSAGSDPGPVCYDRGGDQPTLTDVFLQLGYVNPLFLVGGDLKLNAGRSARALERVLQPLRKPTVEACYGIYELAVSTMVRAVKAVTSYRGRDPREFALVAFGGNGPLVAAGIASALGLSRILIPPNPGVFSAVGLVTAPPGIEFGRTLLRKTRDLTLDEIESCYAALEEKARTSMEEGGHDRSAVRIRRSAELRYAGQGHELSIALAALASISEMEARFTQEHLRTYGHKADTDPVELVNLKVFATLDDTSSNPEHIPASEVASARRPDRLASVRREAYFGPAHGSMEVPVLSRQDLGVNEPLDGPIIIEEYDSTCIVPPGFNVQVDARGNIDISTSSPIF